MEATATLRYLKASPQKVRLIVDLVRGKKVGGVLCEAAWAGARASPFCRSSIDCMTRFQVPCPALFTR